MQQQKINIWDLDGTIINSSNRVNQCLKPNGDLDLDLYRKIACEHELILTDTMLPLVTFMQQSIDKGELNFICTARKCNKSDYYFLRKQGLRGRGTNSVQLLSRDTLYRFINDSDRLRKLYNSKDAEYKKFYFDTLKSNYPDAIFTVFDDHQGVLKTALECGFRAVDATIVNDLLSLGITLGSEEILDDIETEVLSDYEHLKDLVTFAWDSMTLDEQREYNAN